MCNNFSFNRSINFICYSHEQLKGAKLCSWSCFCQPLIEPSLREWSHRCVLFSLYNRNCCMNTVEISIITRWFIGNLKSTKSVEVLDGHENKNDNFCNVRIQCKYVSTFYNAWAKELLLCCIKRDKIHAEFGRGKIFSNLIFIVFLRCMLPEFLSEMRRYIDLRHSDISVVLWTVRKKQEL